MDPIDKFYGSKAWQKCRKAYKQSVGGLCERCLKKGIYKAAVIVHHKIYIDDVRINDPNVTLNFNNLEALCRECHEAEHHEDNQAARRKYGQSVSKKRYTIDQFGRVKAREVAPPMPKK